MAKLLTFLHRWLGVLLGFFFAMWFFSGAIMMYVPFPSVSDEERLTYLAEINTTELNISPPAALEQCGSERVTGLRVISVISRPAYICSTDYPVKKVIYADDGTTAPPLQKPDIAQLANDVVRVPVKEIAETDYDQWTVHQRFDAYRPFYRLSLDDADETNLYVSSITGEFLQRTTSFQRYWNYIGAIPHWIYPTILRKNWALWDAMVWWISLAAIITAVIGVYLGIRHWLRVRQRLNAVISPFQGMLRWHHVAGLFSGVIVVSWIFSGWLSMDHGRIFSTPNPTPDQVKALRGGSFYDVVSKIDLTDSTKYSDAKELKFHGLGGVPSIVAKGDSGIIDAPVLEPNFVARVVGEALPNLQVKRWGFVEKNDVYTDLREGSLPAGTIRVELSDRGQTWLHIDNRSGELITVIDRSRRIYRWLYNGLHSLDIPGVSNRRPMWDVLMLALLSAGFIASLTGAILGLRRLFITTLR